MQNAKSQVKWLILLVLFIAAAVCFTVYRGAWGADDVPTAAITDGDGNMGDGSGGNGNNGGGSGDGGNGGGSGGEEEPGEEPELPPDNIYYSVLPRAATTLQDGSVYQHVGGIGSEVLKAVHLRGDGKSVVMVETASNGYDFRASARSVGAALFSRGALEKTITLDPGESYLDSVISGFGIFVAAKGNGYIKHYRIAPDFESVTKKTLAAGKDAEYLLSGVRTDGAYLLLLAGRTLSLNYIDADGNLEFVYDRALEDAEGIVAAYEYVNGAAVFTNGVNHASVTLFNVINGINQSKTLNNSEFVQIMPMPIEIAAFTYGFVCLTKRGESLRLVCLSETLSELRDEALNLSYARMSRLDGEKGFLLIGDGKADYYCEHVERNFSLNAAAVNGEIEDECGYKDGKLFAVKTASGVSLIAYSGGAFTVVRTVEGVRNATLYGGDDGESAALFGEVYGRTYENFGDGDVVYFLLAIA
ncbi:MAG: hypothetical protein LBT55_00315 [Clostridiaceae bacterium]|nr:hypothetical protein [Clostridiaceae bacterium]